MLISQIWRDTSEYGSVADNLFSLLTYLKAMTEKLLHGIKRLEYPKYVHLNLVDDIFNSHFYVKQTSHRK